MGALFEDKMLLRCFNCPDCRMPFDEKEEMPRTPVLQENLREIQCSNCRGGDGEIVIAWCLLDILNEGWLHKTEEGYIVCGQIKLPKCPDCSVAYTPVYPWQPIFLPCGHLCCNECVRENDAHVCQRCGNAVESDGILFANSPVFTLIQELAIHWLTKFETNLEGIEVPPRDVSVLLCNDCGKEDAIDRMFRCYDCLQVVCAFCVIKKHPRHHHQILSEAGELSDAEKLEKRLAISLDCFNCDGCNNPFDAKAGMPRTPMINDEFVVSCATCQSEEATNVPLFGLIEFLEKPYMKKTEGGYICLERPQLPECSNCESTIDTWDWMLNLQCGHLLCWNCCESGVNESKCSVCEQEYSTEDDYENEHFLRFLYELATQWTKVSDPAKEPELTRPPAPLNCDDCNIEQPMERLLNCKDCSKTTCGFCYVAQHMNHQFEKLLVAKLSDLEHTIDKRLEIGFIGLQGIVDGLHEQMKKRMRELIEVAAARGKTIHDQPTFRDGQQIFGDLEEMVAKFESRCENYFPLIRQFSEKLVDWKEGLEDQDEQPVEGTQVSQV